MAATLRSDALSDIDSMEDFLGVTLTASQREAMTRIINGLTEAFHSFTGRKLKARDYSPSTTEDDAILNGNNQTYLYLPQMPVNSLTNLLVELEEIREIKRRDIAVVTGTTLKCSGFSFRAQDSELMRGIVSVSPNNTTEETEATITSVAGDTATFSGGWTNGTPAASSQWWFGEGAHLKKDSGKLVLTHGTFPEGTNNVRVWYNAGYASGSNELYHLQELCTSLSAYIWRKGPKTGFASETLGSYSYSLGSAGFKDFWAVNDIGGLEQYRDWRKFL